MLAFEWADSSTTEASEACLRLEQVKFKYVGKESLVVLPMIRKRRQLVELLA